MPSSWLPAFSKGVSQVVKGLRQTVTKRGLTGSHKKDLLAVATYFQNNTRYMQYHEYLAAGFPIASGPVEGACKKLIKDRMDRSGMRWTPDMAEAIVKLRSLYEPIYVENAPFMHTNTDHPGPTEDEF